MFMRVCCIYCVCMTVEVVSDSISRLMILGVIYGVLLIKIYSIYPNVLTAVQTPTPRLAKSQVI